MPLSFTKIDALPQLAKLSAPFDKEITKLEGLVKQEKDKKKKATYEKDLKQLKTNRSKALGEKLAELQKTNADDALKLFSMIEGCAIKAGHMSGKAKVAFEALKKEPAKREHVTNLLSYLNAVKDLPDEMARESKAFVDAQGPLRENGVIKNIDPPDLGAFNKLRLKLIDDNKVYKQKMISVGQIVKSLETLHKTGDALSTKVGQTSSQVRGAAETQIQAFDKDLSDLTTMAKTVPDKADRIISNSKSKDPGIVTVIVALGNEMLGFDKRFRDGIKNARTKHAAIASLVKKLTGADDLNKWVTDAKGKIDKLDSDMAAATPKLKQALTIFNARKNEKKK